MLPFGIALATALAQVISDEPGEPPAAPVVWRSSRHVLVLSAGAAPWPGLRGIGRLETPPGWAPFGSAGFALGGAYRYNARYLGGAELLLGGSAALIVTRAGRPDGAPVNQAGDPAPDLWMIATGLAATLDAQLQRAAGPLRPFVSAGVGAYDLTFSLEDKNQYLGPGEDVFKRTRPGGWLGAGGDYRFGPPELCWGVVAELRVHLVDFGSARDVAPKAGSLRGPIYMFTLGVLFGFGH